MERIWQVALLSLALAGCATVPVAAPLLPIDPKPNVVIVPPQCGQASHNREPICIPSSKDPNHERRISPWQLCADVEPPGAMSKYPAILIYGDNTVDYLAPCWSA